MKKEYENYQEFFKEEIYDGFVNFLIHELEHATVIALVKDEPIFTKKGVHVELGRYFNQFLAKNPKIERIFAFNNYKCILQKNICGEPLHFPVNVNDESLMVAKGIRLPELKPHVFDCGKPTKGEKASAAPMKGQILKTNWKEGKFLAPMKLIVHFKKSMDIKNGKTTKSFVVNSQREINTIIFDIYRNRVAFAKCGHLKYNFEKKVKHSKV